MVSVVRIEGCLLTPMPVIAGFEGNSPCSTEPVVQFVSGSQGYRLEHSRTEVAVPIVVFRPNN